MPVAKIKIEKKSQHPKRQPKIDKSNEVKVVVDVEAWKKCLKRV
jgi:hypothetical protein